MSYEKVRCVNNWEHLEYYLGAGETRIQAGLYDARWPDGTEERVSVQARNKSGTYHDMGHTYPYTTIQLYLTVDVHGHPVDVPLEKLDIGLAIP